MGKGALRDPTDRLHAGLLALLVVGGAVARLTLMGEPMRYDEAFTFLNYAMASIGHIVSTYDFPNNHVLYSLLAHFSWRAFGDHVWTVRLPAFAAGVALIPAAYLAARELYDRWAGIWAAALATGFSALIDYSVNGRGYTLGILLVVLSLWIAARLLRRPRRREWALLVVLWTLAVYTVPTMAFGVAAVAAWMVGTALLRHERRDVGLVVRLGVVLALAAGLSLLLYSGVLGQAGWTFVKPVPTDWTPLAHAASRVWRVWNHAQPHPLNWLVGAGFATALVLHRRIARHPVPIGVAALAALLVVIVAGQVSPFERTFLYLLPLYLIQASGGLSYLFGPIAWPVACPVAPSPLERPRYSPLERWLPTCCTKASSRRRAADDRQRHGRFPQAARRTAGGRASLLPERRGAGRLLLPPLPLSAARPACAPHALSRTRAVIAIDVLPVVAARRSARCWMGNPPRFPPASPRAARVPHGLGGRGRVRTAQAVVPCGACGVASWRHSRIRPFLITKRTAAVPPSRQRPPRPTRSLNDASEARPWRTIDVTSARHGRLRLNSTAAARVASRKVWTCCTSAPRTK